MRDWINPDYLTNPEAIGAAYRAAHPFPHASWPDFLLPEKAEALANALSDLEFTRKEADLFSFSQSADLRDIGDPMIQEFLGIIQSEEFSALMSRVTGIPLVPGAADTFASLYQDTDYLLCHDDELDNRRIALVLNLSKGFTERSGGALALLDSDTEGRPKQVVQRLVPGWNTLNFFTVSPISHHMVEEVLEEKRRLAFSGWLYD